MPIIAHWTLLLQAYLLENKKLYLMVELSGGSDGARTLMYDTMANYTSNRRFTIHCFRVASISNTIRGDVIANPSPEYLKISGQKSLDVMVVARVCDS